MISTILFVVESPFSERDYSRFGVDILKNNFNVIIFDCTKLIKPQFHSEYKHLAVRHNDLHEISNVMQFTLLLKDLKEESLCIDMLGSNVRSEAMRSILARRGIKRVVLMLGSLPVLNIQMRIMPLLKNPGVIFKKIIKRFNSLNQQKANPPDIAMYAGIKSLEDSRLSGARHLIGTHSYDYESYLNCIGKPAILRNPYAIFLDEDMVYHSDYKHAGLRPPATADNYYDSMQLFFSHFQKNSSLPVIVAAHPRAEYGLRPKVWGDQIIYTGVTPELVRDAKIVFCHQSTSLSFAMLWRKPVCLLTTSEVDSSYLGPRINFLGKLIKVPVINVDDKKSMTSFSEIPIPNIAAYEDYVNSYIKTPDSPEVSIWVSLINYVESSCN